MKTENEKLVVELGLDSLAPSETNPRSHFDDAEMANLVASVAKHGIMQPLLVRAKDGVDMWEIVAGERRWTAARKAGLIVAPVIIKDLTDVEVVEIQLAENIDRHDLSPMEEADGVMYLNHAIEKTGKFIGEMDSEIAARLGRGVDWVQTRFKLFDLPEVMQDCVRNRTIGVGVACEVLRVKAEDREAAAQSVLELGDEKAVSQVRDLLAARYVEPNRRRDDWKHTFRTLTS